MVSLARTIESPCRNCENVHLNKEECSNDCERLKAFQDAIIHFDESNIEAFGMKYGLGRA